ncbi:MAG: hypothetical protein EA425_11965 [Puniceicoccaceae bacterium]|nr:MAG: hypothetical protein EA425_11965 [Puniceicoccaceae bacterium]
MNSGERCRLLLEAYERTTELEAFALARQDAVYLGELQTKKNRLIEGLCRHLPEAEFEDSERERWNGRIAALTEKQGEHLRQVGQELAQLKSSLAETSFATRHIRQVRHAYVPAESRSDEVPGISGLA